MSYILTLVSSNSSLLKDHFDEIATHLGLNLGTINWLNEGKAGNVHLTNPIDIETVKNLRALLENDKIDIFCTPAKNRAKKLLLADMDATIVTSETLDELADEIGIKDKISYITEKAMRGELDFYAALKERVGLLQGLSTEALQRTLDKTELSQGAETLVKSMRLKNSFCVLVSGGFTYFTKNVANQVGFNSHHGNILEIENSALTGNVIEPILDKDTKLKYLREYAKKLGITLSDTVAIGDGANDLPMLQAAGLGIGYHPKPALENTLINCIRHTDLTSVLYVQGYNHKEFAI